MLTIKKIAELINTENAKINYYVFNKNNNKNYILYLKVLSDEDKIIYESMGNIEKSEYISESAQIYLPKMSVDYCANIYRESGSYDFEYTCDKVKKLEIINNNDVNTAVVLYMILHEFGHWNDFISKNKNVFSYSMPDSKEAKDVWEYGNRIKFKMGTKSFLDEKDKELLKAYTNRYNAVPIEERANLYADTHYKDAFAKLKEAGFVS